MAKNKNKTILFVLGMHRSGTSALAGMLSKLGAGLPKTLMESHATNAKGFFESVAVMNINNEILKQGGSHWKDYRAFELPSEKRAAAIERIGQVLENEFMGHDFIVVKDPRICRMAPLWWAAAALKGYTPLILVPYRHPREVVGSMHARDALSVAEGLLIWLRYVLDAEKVTRGMPRVFVPMSGLLQDWRGVVARISGNLNIEWPINPDAAAQEIDEFIDKGLKHQTVTETALETDPLLRGWVSETFMALEGLSLGDDAGLRNRLDIVKERLDTACTLFGPAIEDKNIQIGTLEKLNKTAAQAIEATKTAAAFTEGKLTAEKDFVQARLIESQTANSTLEEQISTLRTANHALEEQISTLRIESALDKARPKSQRDQLKGQVRHNKEAYERLVADQVIQQARFAEAKLEFAHQRKLFEVQLENSNARFNARSGNLEAHLSAMTVDRDEHKRLLNRYRGAARVHFLAWALNKGLRPA